MRLGFARVLGFAFRFDGVAARPAAPTWSPIRAHVRALSESFSKTSGIDLSISAQR